MQQKQGKGHGITVGWNCVGRTHLAMLAIVIFYWSLIAIRFNYGYADPSIFQRILFLIWILYAFPIP